MCRSEKKILVLNADNQPLNITTFRKGFKLLHKGKAEVYRSDANDIILASITMERPTIIRLLKYLYTPYRKINLSKQNIYKRDGYACVYCGSDSDLTLDHVTPRSRGGGNTWENLVTCCKPCNSRKDNRTPSEAGMRMRVKPFVPSFTHLISVTDLGFDLGRVAQA